MNRAEQARCFGGLSRLEVEAAIARHSECRAGWYGLAQRAYERETWNPFVSEEEEARLRRDHYELCMAHVAACDTAIGRLSQFRA